MFVNTFVKVDCFNLPMLIDTDKTKYICMDGSGDIFGFYSKPKFNEETFIWEAGDDSSLIDPIVFLGNFMELMLSFEKEKNIVLDNGVSFFMRQNINLMNEPLECRATSNHRFISDAKETLLKFDNETKTMVKC